MIRRWDIMLEDDRWNKMINVNCTMGQTYAERGTHSDDVEQDTNSEFMESFNTTILSERTEMVDDLKQTKHKKLKKPSGKTFTRSRSTMKEEINQCVESFTEVAKSLIGSRKTTTPMDELLDLIKAAIDILNNTEDVEVASPFWLNAIEILEN